MEEKVCDDEEIILKYAVFSPIGGLIAKVQTQMSVNAIMAFYPKKSRKMMKAVKIHEAYYPNKSKN